MCAWAKTSRHERGYGSEWDKLRRQILERDKGLCQPCRRAGRARPATQVDHIVSKAKAKTMRWSEARVNAETNLQAICKSCHDEKTLAETGRKSQPKVAIGLDGWPIEGDV